MVELRLPERKTLLTIERLGGVASIEQIASESGLTDAAVMRAVLTLQEKKLVDIREEKTTVIKLKKRRRNIRQRRLTRKAPIKCSKKSWWNSFHRSRR